MTRSETEDDDVFEQAVVAALNSVRDREPPPDFGRLRRAIEIAKPWAMAQAHDQRSAYVHLSVWSRRYRNRWATNHPLLWRWGLVLVIPTIVWPLVALVRDYEVLAVVAIALIALVVSLAAVALSYRRGMGALFSATWAGLGLIAPAQVTLRLDQLGWWALVLTVFTMVLTAVSVIFISPWSFGAAVHDLNELLDEWRSAVLNDGVMPVLRAELRSSQVVPGVELGYRNAEGLQRGGSLNSHQPVPAGKKLAELVRSLNSGSFALAGPRGAGKTSLLEAFCQGAYREPKQQLDLAVMVSAPVDYVPREFVLHLYARTCQAVLSHLEETTPRAVKKAGRRDRWWRSPDDVTELARAARRGLQNIAFVQTRSGETSGKFGFRGAEISYKRGTSLAGRPATFPELVDDFRGFVRLAASTLTPTRVVIVIDEMDRIGAGEPARKFLNEIKAIFDVPGCYYLMSVSTEAQHDFELAGMGLRSVFDSSFDEVVRADYLDFNLAKGLISRSVEDLPDSFVALAYAFSGGLARQLTRSARAIVRQPQGAMLAAVAEELIADELDRVLKTTGDALTATDNQEGVTTLLRVLADPSEDLRDQRKAIQAAYDGEDAAIRNLRDLAAARIEFLAVVRDYFTNDLTEVVPAHVNALARARRYAGSNPATGLALLEEFSAETTARPAPTPQPQ